MNMFRCRNEQKQAGDCQIHLEMRKQETTTAPLEKGQLWRNGERLHANLGIGQDDSSITK